HEAVPALRAHGAGIHGDEVDVEATVLAGERPGEVLAGGVACARHDLPVRVFHAVVANEIDAAPAALLLHDRQRGAQTADVAHELELKTLLPGVLVQALEHAARRGPGVV